ncbi:SusD/RagB family nutrient-binding outer membrane lipoprotein [Flavobacterium wongokense]|uniref:SusD/RagB family nutrient-binding outer membrane lipoprotein n=1 Tax=Flavobacterium wongokense TaxID=2910674 RepID=UPI001F482589|nr:SusD/RagB family nutrient-binding outer membrane lipoprotein [Flavobacterium sp. WG47]MCF6133077.1 SusD/RagB family nutrient-binding outer membrane lipoprotein [Flavobacterium sp. WG47]
MKKIFLFLFVFAGLYSCSDDITDLNEDTVNPTEVPAEFLFTNAQKNMVDQMVSTSVNFNVFRLFTQQWTETTYTDESNYDVATRTIPDNHWQVIYRDVLRDLKESRTVLAEEVYTGTPAEIATQEAERINKGHVIDIMSAYAYYVLVDTFGDVPYTEALDPLEHPLPKYDDGETIYKDLIAKLTAASHGLDTNFGSFGSQDLMYGGDTAQWQKFANSVRLQMAINLDDIDHTYASAQALAAVTDGVIVDNADNASLTYLSAQPNTNPIYVDVVASGRDDFVPTATIIEQMNNLNDPRRAMYFTQIGGIYEGGEPGSSNNFANFSHIGPMILEPTFEGLIMDAAQVEFLLAEAVERGIAVGGSAESHYNAAITASMDYWGVSGADQAAYLAQTDVAYTTATGTWQQKIGEQAYLGLYNRGFESWTSFRRLDFPVLIAPADANETEVPTRLTYPAREETLNATNVEAAITAIGGNTLTTKLFWDIH